MKKIINNKVYDTAKAELVGEWNTRWEDRLYRCCEELYRKRTGEFFLYGYGGPGSKYAVSTGNSDWSGGEKIIPLTYEAAQKWAEEHLTGEEYEAIFGEIVEDDNKIMVSLYLQSSKVEQCKRNAARAEISLSAYLEKLIDTVVGV